MHGLLCNHKLLFNVRQASTTTTTSTNNNDMYLFKKINWWSVCKIRKKLGGGESLSVGEFREVRGVEFTLVTFVMLVVLVHFLECLEKKKNEPL